MRINNVVCLAALAIAVLALILSVVLPGPKGKEGAAGLGIESTVDNGDGTFTITFTDGSTFTTDNLTGPTMPIIQSLSVSDLPAKPGATVAATVVAQSASALTLTYGWIVSAGWAIASGGDSSTVTIIAPAMYATTGMATVTVTDSSNRTATGTIALTTEKNQAPVIHHISASPNPVRKGGTMEISVSASDPNGDTLAYNWSVPSGWMIQSGQTTAHIVVVAPTRLLASGMVAVTVGDGKAGSASASLYVGTLDGSWGTAEHLMGVSTHDATQPDIAIDPYGNAMAVWRLYDGARWNVWANRFVVGTGWGSPVLIETDDSGDAVSPQVAMDSSGNAMAVWYQSDGVRNNIWANRYVPAAGWATATPVETASGDALRPQVAMDSAGNAIVVWYQSDGVRYNIRANRYVPGAGWGSAVFLEMGDWNAEYPRIAADSNGNAMVVWSQSDGARFNIWANRYVSGIGWGTAALVEAEDSGSASYPQVAVDPMGNAIAVWYQWDGGVNNIWANRYMTATGWATATLIETESSDSLDPRVALDFNGNAAVVWRQYYDLKDDIWANRFVAGTGWGTPVLIETMRAGAAATEVAMDSSGNALVLWGAFDGLRHSIWANRYTPTTGWGTAVLLETVDGEASDPQVAIDSGGNAMAVWTQHDGVAFNIWANRFE